MPWVSIPFKSAYTHHGRMVLLYQLLTLFKLVNLIGNKSEMVRLEEEFLDGLFTPFEKTRVVGKDRDHEIDNTS